MLTDPKDKHHRSSEFPSTISSNLLHELRQESDFAWEKMVDLYYPMIYGWCRRSGLQPQDSADVCQDVLRSIVTSLHKFRREDVESTFRGWLRRITQRRIYDFRERGKKHPEAVGGSDAQDRLAQLPAIDSNSSHTDEVKTTQLPLLEQVQSEFESLTWDAFWKTAIDGEPAGEVAKSLNISRNSVYLAKSRVLRRLRETYDYPFERVAKKETDLESGASNQ